MPQAEQLLLLSEPSTIPANARWAHPLFVRVRALPSEHGRAFTSFGIIGASVFGMGLALLYILVHLLHVGASLAFLLQSIVSVEVSFLLNWNLTWKQRETPFKTAAKRFHAMRIATIPVNQLIFLGLRDLGVEYLLAMVVTVGFFTAINYAVCHIWTFPDVIVSEPAEVMAEEI